MSRDLRMIWFLALLSISAVARADTSTTGGARVIENPTQDGNLILRVNDGGVRTDAISVNGATSVTTLAQPLPVASGGSGITSGTAGGVPYFSTTTQQASTAQMTAGRILLGNASNVPTATAVTGDVTISSTGVTTIGSGSVNSTKILDNSITGSDISTTTTITAGRTLIGDGSATSPSYSFSSDANSGIYWSSATSEVATSVNGAVKLVVGPLEISAASGVDIATNSGAVLTQAIGLDGVLFLKRVTAADTVACNTQCANLTGGYSCIAGILLSSSGAQTGCTSTSGTRRCLCMNETL